MEDIRPRFSEVCLTEGVKLAITTGSQLVVGASRRRRLLCQISSDRRGHLTDSITRGPTEISLDV
jgi:hypothetical protein